VSLASGFNVISVEAFQNIETHFEALADICALKKKQFCVSLYLAPPKSEKHRCTRAWVGTEIENQKFAM